MRRAWMENSSRIICSSESERWAGFTGMSWSFYQRTWWFHGISVRQDWELAENNWRVNVNKTVDMGKKLDLIDFTIKTRKPMFANANTGPRGLPMFFAKTIRCEDKHGLTMSNLDENTHIYIYNYLIIYLYIHTAIHIYMCNNIYTYTYIHACMHAYTYIYIHIHTYTYIYIHIHTYTYIYIHKHTYTYIYTHIHTYIHTYIITHIYIYIT